MSIFVRFAEMLRTAAQPGGGRSSLLLRVALGATLLLPLVLMVSRAAADALIVITAVLFLLTQWLNREWRWLVAPWTIVGLLLWGWMLTCSLIMAGFPADLQAVAAIRYFVFIAALENWVLRDVRARDALYWVIIAVTLFLVVECWQQQFYTTNIFGFPRWGDGALTGPFYGPRAGPTYLLLFFPAFLPVLLSLIRQRGWLPRTAAFLISAIATVTMILIGQRMPTVLLFLGLGAAGLLYRQFRLPVVLTLAAAVVMLALTPIVSPPTFAKLVVRFANQLDHFWSTDYGLLFARAVTMIQAHPWLGLGWDGFRNNCMNPLYLGGLDWLPVSDPASPGGCNVHPHNYWTQIATTAGLPGIAVFAVLVGLWLWRIAGGSAYLANGRRGALLILVIIAMWPIASTTSLFTIPNAGWTFLLIAWGLAEARADPVENHESV